MTQRKAEEERDLFKLWKEELESDSRSMKIPSGGARVTATSSVEDAAHSSSRGVYVQSSLYFYKRNSLIEIILFLLLCFYKQLMYFLQDRTEFLRVL